MGLMLWLPELLVLGVRVQGVMGLMLARVGGVRGSIFME
jgi:hypothetical protein